MAATQRAQQGTALALIPVFLLCYTACKSPDGGNTPENSVSAPSAVPAIGWSVKGTLPHDTALFTEGFVIHDGKTFESTG